MKGFFLLLMTMSMISACRLQPDSDRKYDQLHPERLYKVVFQPEKGAAYHYDISRETVYSFTVEEQDFSNISRVDAGVTYTISGIDSLGNYHISLKYDRIQLYAKSKDVITKLDADGPETAYDPIAKMLMTVKNQPLMAIVSPKGEITEIEGYNQLGEKIMTNIGETDLEAASLLKQKWEMVLGNGLIRQQMEQLFQLFPDSTIHVNDTWKTNLREQGELPLNQSITYQLKSIDPAIARVKSNGRIRSESSQLSFPGISGAAFALTGESKGEYRIETATGICIDSETDSKLNGVLNYMGREIPLLIKMESQVHGKRVDKGE